MPTSQCFVRVQGADPRTQGGHLHSAIQELCLDTVLTSEEGAVSAQLRTCVAQSADLGRVEWGLQSVGVGLAGVPFRPQTWGAPLGV